MQYNNNLIIVYKFGIQHNNNNDQCFKCTILLQFNFLLGKYSKTFTFRTKNIFYVYMKIFKKNTHFKNNLCYTFYMQGTV